MPSRSHSLVRRVHVHRHLIGLITRSTRLLSVLGIDDKRLSYCLQLVLHFVPPPLVGARHKSVQLACAHMCSHNHQPRKLLQHSSALFEWRPSAKAY